MNSSPASPTYADLWGAVGAIGSVGQFIVVSLATAIAYHQIHVWRSQAKFGRISLLAEDLLIALDHFERELGFFPVVVEPGPDQDDHREAELKAILGHLLGLGSQISEINRIALRLQVYVSLPEIDNTTKTLFGLRWERMRATARLRNLLQKQKVSGSLSDRDSELLDKYSAIAYDENDLGHSAKQVISELRAKLLPILRLEHTV